MERWASVSSQVAAVAACVQQSGSLAGLKRDPQDSQVQVRVVGAPSSYSPQRADGSHPDGVLAQVSGLVAVAIQGPPYGRSRYTPFLSLATALDTGRGRQ